MEHEKIEKVDRITFPSETFIPEDAYRELEEWFNNEKIEIEENEFIKNKEEKIKRLEELKEKYINELTEQESYLDKKMNELSEKLYEKFKGWVIKEKDEDSICGVVWYEKYLLENPETGEKAEVYIALDWEESVVKDPVGIYYIYYYYKIYDKNGNLIEEKEEIIYPY